MARYSWISPINDLGGGLLGQCPAPFGGAFNAYQLPARPRSPGSSTSRDPELVSFDTPNAPAEDIAERDAIFDTIRIEP
jgi:hypothetical protein